MNKELTKILNKAEDGKVPVFPSETAEIAQYIDRHGAIKNQQGRIINARQLRLNYLNKMIDCVPDITESEPDLGRGLETTLSDMKRLQHEMKYLDDTDNIPIKFFNEELMVHTDLTAIKNSPNASDKCKRNIVAISNTMSILNGRDYQIDNIFYVDAKTKSVSNIDAGQVQEFFDLGKPQLEEE